MLNVTVNLNYFFGNDLTNCPIAKISNSLNSAIEKHNGIITISQGGHEPIKVDGYSEKKQVHIVQSEIASILLKFANVEINEDEWLYEVSWHHEVYVTHDDGWVEVEDTNIITVATGITKDQVRLLQGSIDENWQFVYYVDELDEDGENMYDWISMYEWGY